MMEYCNSELDPRSIIPSLHRESSSTKSMGERRKKTFSTTKIPVFQYSTFQFLLTPETRNLTPETEAYVLTKEERPVMNSKKILAIFGFLVIGGLCWSHALLAQSTPSAPTPADPWPRELKLSNAKVLLYQPQLESWEHNKLHFRAVVAVTPTGTKREIFGVIWGTARTHVDWIERMVTLEDLDLKRSKFPTLADNGASYMRALQQQSVAAQRTISLDRMQAMLAASGTVKPQPVQVNNDPPRIIVAASPAMLVPISGNPVIRAVPGTNFERVINTEALILRQAGESTFYLHIYDGWVYSSTLAEPWYQPMVFPPGIDQVATNLAKSGEVEMLDGGNTQPKPSLAKGLPAIYVTEKPAELLVFHGLPNFTPIAGTNLQWAANTTADVILDSTSSNYYVLVSGRWFRSSSLTEAGPWTYTANNSLPADFSRIPVDSPAGVVLRPSPARRRRRKRSSPTRYRKRRPSSAPTVPSFLLCMTARRSFNRLAARRCNTWSIHRPQSFASTRIVITRFQAACGSPQLRQAVHGWWRPTCPR
jgi:hypothetical protein